MGGHKVYRIGQTGDFLVGAAMSAHQVEGNNTHSDWWHWEQAGKLPGSGLACNYWERFAEDHQIAKDIGLDALRISIEWARLEPEQGKWDGDVLEHYRSILRDMKSRGLKVFVTLQHFTLPLWAAKMGGFRNKKVREHFANYCARIVPSLQKEVEVWFTINEPTVTALLSYLHGVHPPFKKNPWLYWRTIITLAKAHNLAYAAIKSAAPEASVGIVSNLVYYEPYQDNFIDKWICKVAGFFGNNYFLRLLRSSSSPPPNLPHQGGGTGHTNRVIHSYNFDCIGLNYYFYHTLTFNPLKGFEMVNEKRPRSDMGWRTYPEGIYHILKTLKRYQKPIYITENGIANARDDMRKDYIHEHIKWSLKARSEGVDVRGYFYWSLLDNFEWHDGYDPKFGLVEVNFETQERKIRKSAEVFRKIKT